MLTLRIITPDRSLPEFQAEHVTIVSLDGELGIRTGHAAVAALLKPAGHVLARAKSGTVRVTAVLGGVAQVCRDQVVVLADAAIPADQVDASKVKARLEHLRANPPAVESDVVVQTAHRREIAWLETQLRLPRQVLSRDEMLEHADAHAKASAAPH